MNGIQSGLIAALIFSALFYFGYWFNHYVEKTRDDADGFVWLLVVFGNFVTLIGIGLLDLALDWNAGLLGLAAFASSGVFMAYGAIHRYITARRRLKVMAKDDASQTLAE
jgi:hypothetical protein